MNNQTRFYHIQQYTNNQWETICGADTLNQAKTYLKEYQAVFSGELYRIKVVDKGV